MNKTITVSNLNKSYGHNKVVDGISFEVEKGEIFGLLGHNGAGKSTTIECILGVKAFDSGKVKVLGMNPAKDRKALYEKVGVQLQQSSYQENIKVKEICEVTHSLYKKSSDWKALLHTFGLSHKENQFVSELSGGERQKLSVLLALIPNPEVVFLDELTTGLDLQARREVWKELDKLKDRGITILLTSHYMDEVESLCDKICILKKGRIEAMGSIEELVHESPYKNLEDAYLWYTKEEGDQDESI